MNKLIICEKPSQAQDIARALGLKDRKKGYFVTDSDDFVSYAVGHLFKQLMPDSYNKDWKYMNKRPFPMVPPKWGIEPDHEKMDQIRAIGDLLKVCSSVVIACDAGREGELIGREILEYFKISKPVQRLWISSLTQEAILEGFGKLKPGSETENLYEAALARSHADWLWGLNLTTKMTLRANTYGLTLPIGRVQTAALGMLVDRELAIQSFKAEDYFDLEIEVKNKSGSQVKLKCTLKPEERIKNKAAADKVLSEIKALKSLPIEVTEKSVQEKPALFHTLTTLQADANRLHGFTAAKTLELTQKLYDNKIVSYPRTDCPYMGQDQISKIPSILKRLQSDATAGALASRLSSTDLTFRDSTFDDSKLSDHHGLMPTGQMKSMTSDEEKIFELILHRFLQQLSPDCQADLTQLSVSYKGYNFVKNGKVIKFPGWRAI